MKNLILRTVTGVAFVAVMVAGILYSPISLWVLFLIINIVLIPALVVLCGIAWGVVRRLKWRRRTA